MYVLKEKQKKPNWYKDIPKNPFHNAENNGTNSNAQGQKNGSAIKA